MAQGFIVDAIPDAIFTTYEVAQKAAEAKKKEDKKETGTNEYKQILRDEHASETLRKERIGAIDDLGGKSPQEQLKYLQTLEQKPIDVAGYSSVTGKELMEKPPLTDRKSMFAMEHPEVAKGGWDALSTLGDIGKKTADARQTEFETGEKERVARVRDASPEGLRQWNAENRDINPEAASFVEKALDAGNVELATEIQQKMLDWAEQMRRAETTAGYAMERTRLTQKPDAPIGTPAGMKLTPLQSGEMKDLNMIASTAATIQKIEGAMKNVEDLKYGPIKGSITSKNPYDKDIQQLEFLVNTIVPGMARGIFKEVGVLTDQDIKYYKGLLPGVRKDPTIARNILNSLKEKVNEAYNISLGTYESAGRDVSGFQQGDVWEFANAFKNSQKRGGTATDVNSGSGNKVGRFTIEVE